jgi:hypothetical protein
VQIPTPDPDLTAHRTRANRRPEPQPHAELVAAVEAVFDGPIEDRQ